VCVYVCVCVCLIWPRPRLWLCWLSVAIAPFASQVAAVTAVAAKIEPAAAMPKKEPAKWLARLDVPTWDKAIASARSVCWSKLWGVVCDGAGTLHGPGDRRVQG